jgi:PAS domain S-box-containing protein
MILDFYKRLIDDANDIIWAVDTEGRFIYLNNKISEWGYNKDELIGKPLISILNKGKMENSLDNGLDIGKNGLNEIEVVDSHGNIRKTSLSTSPLKDDKGSIAGTIGIVRDMAEDKRLQERIADTERLASLGQLSLGIAHEIRNPLSSIKMNLQILNRLIPFVGDTKEHFDLALKEVFHLEGILEDLLSYAKPLKLNLKLMDINSLLDNTLLMVKSDVKDKEIVINRYFDNELPKILLDEDKMKQAFLNIYLNSIQAMNKGGTLCIRTYRERENPDINGIEKRVVVEVSDTGCGIDRDKIKNIFDPFFTTKPYGTGLGLSIVKNIFDYLNAIIEVNSQPDKGTDFIIKFPITQI